MTAMRNGDRRVSRRYSLGLSVGELMILASADLSGEDLVREVLRAKIRTLLASAYGGTDQWQHKAPPYCKPSTVQPDPVLAMAVEAVFQAERELVGAREQYERLLRRRQ